MTLEHPYRPCPSCGGVELDNVPDISVEAYRATTALGLPAHQRFGFLVIGLVVCCGCGKTDVFTKNLGDVRSKLHGVTRFRAKG